MLKNKTIISFGDFLDVYTKIKEKGIYFILTKLRIAPASRIASKWDAYTSTSDFWLIPEIQESWNFIISGNKNMLYEDYVYDKYLKDKKNLKMLSVGCGEGYHDRNFAKHDCFSHIDAIDISEKSIESAMEIAKQENLDINYISGDFKKMKLEENTYDLILFSSSLHHFKDVNGTLRDFIKPLMKSDGYLIVFEYAGPNRLQWTRNQLDKANQLLKKLPDNYRLLIDNSTLKKKVYRPGLLRMLAVDPSEAVDSEAIIPSLNSNFKVIEQKSLGWNILHILLKGIAHNFLNDKKQTKDLIRDLLIEEADFVQKEGKTDAIFGVYQKG